MSTFNFFDIYKPPQIWAVSSAALASGVYGVVKMKPIPSLIPSVLLGAAYGATGYKLDLNGNDGLGVSLVTSAFLASHGLSRKGSKSPAVLITVLFAVTFVFAGKVYHDIKSKGTPERYN